jgi:hypothetical protein
MVLSRIVKGRNKRQIGCCVFQGECWNWRWSYVTADGDGQSVGQYILVSGIHLGSTTRFLLILDGCRFLGVGCPLWQKDSSQLLLVIASSHSLVQVMQDSRAIHNCLEFYTPPNLDDQIPLFTSRRKRVAQLYPQALDSSLWYAGWRKSTLHNDWSSVGKSILVSVIWDPWPIFLLF